MARKLTAKQENYKNLRIAGVKPSEAYVQAYDSKSKNSNTINVEAQKLENHPIIAPLLISARKEVAERALVTIEDVVKGLLAEAKCNGEGTSQGARVSAWKELGNFTGGFDKNKQQIEQKNIEMTQEEWLSSLS